MDPMHRAGASPEADVDATVHDAEPAVGSARSGVWERGWSR